MIAFASSSRQGAALIGLLAAFLSTAPLGSAMSDPAGPDADGIEVVTGVKLKGVAVNPFTAESSDVQPESESETAAEVGADAQTPAAAPAATLVGAPDAKAESKSREVFDQRAKKVLEAEGKADLASHPLAAAYPGHDVVVCTAGCRHDTADIVYLERRAGKSTEAAASGLGSLPAEAVRNVVTCVGGCYGEAGSRFAGLHGEAPFLGHAAGSWLTTTRESTASDASAAPPAASPSRWYQRINPSEARPGTP
ncbi:MAG: hypothetical protein NW217_09445 [Hyphomicrobiaceae bacterium]|nr:hypothetical protein [Hyphomicrobiaceae bacterium]